MLNRKSIFSYDPYIVYPLKWPDGSSKDLPTIIVVDLPSYIVDSDDEEEFDEAIMDAIEEVTGTRPLNKFGFGPFEPDEGETLEDFARGYFGWPDDDDAGPA